MGPFGMLKETVDLVRLIKSALETANRNAEDCRRFGELLPTLEAIEEQLRGRPGTLTWDATERLMGARLQAYELVQKCKNKCWLRLAYEADDIAQELGSLRSYLQLFVNMVVAANLVQFRADVDANFVQLRADVAANFVQLRADVADMLQIHLGKEVKELVPAYVYARETQKTMDIATSQNEYKRETNKTNVARLQVKIQQNNGLGDSNALHASLSDKVISRSTKNMTAVTSIDVHPIKKWIVTGHEGGYFSIWDYQKQETVMEMKVNEVPEKKPSILQGISQGISQLFKVPDKKPSVDISQLFKKTAPPHWVSSTKFIVQEKRLAVGDGCGYIYIYTYTDTKLHEVNIFRAYRDTSVDTLCVHPTEPYLLSSSAFGNKIKLWDWSRNWKKIREFDVKSRYPKGVRSLKFNPRDTNTFACVTYDERVMVGNINSSSSLAPVRLKTEILDADYFFTHSQQHWMVTTSSSVSPNFEILLVDLKTGKVVHTLGRSERKMRRVAGHPKLPILVSASDDGTVCYWDASTDRLVEMVQIPDREPDDLVLVTDINGLTRLVAVCETTIAIMEINFANNNYKHTDP